MLKKRFAERRLRNNDELQALPTFRHGHETLLHIREGYLKLCSMKYRALIVNGDVGAFATKISLQHFSRDHRVAVEGLTCHGNNFFPK